MKERRLRDLHAYHDGELGGLCRWWLERSIARDPAARAELARLTQMGSLLRADAAETPAPDLWSQIVLQLPAAAPQTGPDSERRGFGFSLPRWAGALVAAGAIAYALLVVGPTPPAPGPAAAPGSSVLLLDTGRRPAFILQDDREATIIWLLPKQKPDAGRTQDALG